MTRQTLPTDEVLAMLAATPQRLAGLTAGLSSTQLRTPPVPDEWSAVDVLAHLRACVDQWAGSIFRMLSEDHPTIRAIDPRNWVEETDYRALGFAPSLRAFATQRAELLAALEPLSPAGWSRAGTFTGAGAPLQRTVHHQAQRLAIHERPHIKQIARIVKATRDG